MFLPLILAALAQEPTPRGVAHAEHSESPAVVACRGGPSGGYTVSVLTDELTALRRQFTGKKAPISCNGYTVQEKPGYGVCTGAPDGTSWICTNSVGTTLTSECMAPEAALREQVRRLGACPGITPPPPQSNVSERHAHN